LLSPSCPNATAAPETRSGRLVNEYTPAPKRAEESAGHRQDPGVVRKTGYLV
jgi:hypothetical protein